MEKSRSNVKEEYERILKETKKLIEVLKPHMVSFMVESITFRNIINYYLIHTLHNKAIKSSYSVPYLHGKAYSIISTAVFLKMFKFI